MKVQIMEFQKDNNNNKIAIMVQRSLKNSLVSDDKTDCAVKFV